jgi:hypothetical protein
VPAENVDAIAANARPRHGCRAGTRHSSPPSLGLAGTAPSSICAPRPRPLAPFALEAAPSSEPSSLRSAGALSEWPTICSEPNGQIER